MAEYCFPFTSIDGDRTYNATDFAIFYDNLFTNGIVAGVGDGLRVSQLTEPSMKVQVLNGVAMIQGRQYLRNSPLVINVTPGSSTADRVDSIILRLDLLERKIKIMYQQGSESLTRNENYWDIQLSKINIPRNATAVLNSHIVDTRASNDVCGYSVLRGGLNVEGLEQQYRSLLQQAFDEFNQSANENQGNLEHLLTDQQALFQTWLTGLQNQLDENQAGNLQNQLDKLTANNEVIEIEHNLGDFPSVQVLYWEYGLGTVPLEGQPQGISWDGSAPETIPVKLVHPSRKKVSIKVPVDKSILSPKVTQINESEYLLTEGIKSMQIRIGVK